MIRSSDTLFTDFGRLVRLNEAFGMCDCEEIQIQQEDLPNTLLVETKLGNYDIEMRLEDHFEKILQLEEFLVRAECMVGTSGKYTIIIGNEGLS